LKIVPDATDIQITYAGADNRNRNAERTFPEVLELARSIASVVGGARQLVSADLLLPETASAASSADPLDDEAHTRATGAQDALKAARDRLANSLATSAPEANLRGALTQAALFGAPSAFPKLSDTSLDALQIRARSVLAELNRRGGEATAATTPTDVVNAVFGREFVFLRRFKPANSAALGDALTTGPVLGSDRHPIEKWFQGAAQVRAPLGRTRMLNLLAGALGASKAPVKIAQLPHVPGEHWVALAFDGSPRPPTGRLSLVLEQANTASANGEWAGLLLDEWTEVIPSTSELTGIAFNYDDPDSEAPQAILIAVPAVPGGVDGHWDLPSLIDTLRETLDLAKIRAVDSELLGSLSQLLPAIYLATNPRDETVSTDFSTRRIADPVLIS
jgi:hypothetical protein